jgi:hypothetical protein
MIKIPAEYRISHCPYNGSHHRLKHPDGRVTTVPVHKNQDLPKGLLRKIIREDLQLCLNDFIELWNQKP